MLWLSVVSLLAVAGLAAILWRWLARPTGAHDFEPPPGYGFRR